MGNTQTMSFKTTMFFSQERKKRAVNEAIYSFHFWGSILII